MFLKDETTFRIHHPSETDLEGWNPITRVAVNPEQSQSIRGGKFELHEAEAESIICEKFLVSTLVEHINELTDEKINFEEDILPFCKAADKSSTLAPDDSGSLQNVSVSWTEMINHIYEKVGMLNIPRNMYLVEADPNS